MLGSWEGPEDGEMLGLVLGSKLGDALGNKLGDLLGAELGLWLLSMTNTEI